MTAEEILVKAREILSDPQRWRKNRYSDRQKQTFCSVGAIRMAATGSPWKNGTQNAGVAYNILQDKVKENYGEQRVYTWNDKPEREHDEVLAMFDKAIDEARKLEFSDADG